MPLRLAIIGCHLLLIAGISASLVPPATVVRASIAALLVLPLLLTLRGLEQERRTTLQRLAVLLVAYIGGLSVEVVARSGNTISLSIALIAAVLELGLLLALIRRSARSVP